jgi:hypothetical protein
VLESAGYALLGNIVVALGLTLPALFFGSRRGIYLLGLGAAVLAFAIAFPIALILHSAYPRGAPLSVLPLIDPAIEEPLRVLFLSTGAAALATKSGSTQSALAFAFGYALFESVTKTLDSFISYSGMLPTDQLITVLTGPIVVLALHLALSLLAAIMFANHVGVRTVILTTFIVHAAHNASVLWLPQPSDLTTFAITNVVRIGVFGVVMYACLSALCARDMLRADQALSGREV